MNHFAVCLKLTPYCKSPILQLKKKVTHQAQLWLCKNHSCLYVWCEIVAPTPNQKGCMRGLLASINGLRPEQHTLCLLFPINKIIYLATLGLSCGMWDLAPWPGLNPGPLHWGQGVLATGPLGESLLLFPKNAWIWWACPALQTHFPSWLGAQVDLPSWVEQGCPAAAACPPVSFVKPWSGERT